MKRLISLILCIAMVLSLGTVFTSCGDESGSDNAGGNAGGNTPSEDDTSHEHSFTNGKCECGEADPNHEHSFTDGKCVCGADEPEPESDGVIYRVSDNGEYAEVVGADGVKTELEIASEYKGVPVKKIADYAFKGNAEITSVVIPSGIIEIGDEAFAGCEILASISIPESVIAIAANAFSGSDALSYTNEGGLNYLGNADNPYIVFIGASDGYLTKITLNAGTKIVMGGAFETIYSPEYEQIGDGYYVGAGDNPYYMLMKVEYTATAFEVNENTKIIASGAFTDAKDLKTVSLPEGLLTIEKKAFYNAYNLKAISIPNSVSYIGDEAFSNCTMLGSIHLGSGIKYLGRGCFFYDNAVSEITAADGLEGYAISGGAIYDLEKAALIFYAPASTASSYTVMAGTRIIGENAFSSAKLEGVILPDSIEIISTRAFAGCMSLLSCDIPEGVVELGEYSFYNCKKLMSCVLPSTVKKIGSYAFNSCTAISNMSIPSSLEYLGEQVFYTTKPLYLTAEDDYATYVGNEENPYLILIAGKKNITEIKINEGTKFINSSAFANSTATSAVIPDGVTSIGDAAFAYSKIESVTFGAESKCKRIGNSAFSGCNQLISFTFPEGVEEIDINVLSSCKLLEVVNLPSTAKIIKKGAFQCNAKLKEVIIPEGVTYISDSSFYYCDSLTKVVVPESVEVIETGAFYFNFLVTIYCVGSEPKEGWGASWNSGRPVVWNYVEAE